MGTRRIDIGCTFVQWSQRPVHAVFQVEPVLGGIATISDEEWSSDPAIQTRSYRDSYGNEVKGKIWSDFWDPSEGVIPAPG